MCKGRKSTQLNESPDLADGSFSPYDGDIDKFFSSIHDFTNSFSEITKKAVGHAHEHHKRGSGWGWSHWGSDEDSKEGIDSFINRPYQTRTGKEESSSARFRLPFDAFNLFGDGIGRTPYGLYAYPSPSAKEYNTCMKKEGLSLWDSEGYWRCLFPNKQVPSRFMDLKTTSLREEVLTREDFEEQARKAPYSADGSVDLGPKGVFFRSFNDLLSWKNEKYEEDTRRRRERRRKFREGSPRSSASSEKTIVGSNAEVSTNLGPDEVISKETTTEYFSDGTSVTSTVVKKKPFGAKEWATIEETRGPEEGKHGWFWNSK